MAIRAKRKAKSKAKRKKRRKGPRAKHIVLDLGLGPMKALDPSCPVCRKLQEDGEEVHTFDRASGELVPLEESEESEGPAAPTIQITIEADACIAEALGDHEVVILLPAESRVGEMLAFLRYTEPQLGAAFPEGSVEVRRDGGRLTRDTEIEDGDRLRLVARGMPARAKA